MLRVGWVMYEFYDVPGPWDCELTADHRHSGQRSASAANCGFQRLALQQHEKADLMAKRTPILLESR